ncbi:pollen receptor-like kinase 3 [Canna indica]|uniref:Pollen receptor-like kinase 3 n=1 Tax=Canna indica TaxID=4628 RepID=A0AAQ3KVD7_9LILI|nr:pollen receptor-like kinase 3 [Canna indica]
MKRQMAIAFIFYLLIIHQTAISAPMTDADALVLLKESIVDPDHALSSWSTSSPHSPCSWFGVICVSGIITGLRLANLGLSGDINVDALTHFKSLRSISLNNNNFAGPLPPGLARLSTMKSLFLSYNRFSGEVPKEIFTSMKNLKKLWVDHNQFSGPIPASISSVTKLIEIRLENNAFDGAIPSFDISSLKSFNVSNNRLAGPIPPPLARYGASSFAGNPDLCGQPLSSTSCLVLPPPPTSPEAVEPTEEQGTNGNNLGIVVGVVVAVVAFVAIIAFFCGRRRQRQEKIDTIATAGSAEAMESAAAPAAPVGPGTLQKQSSSGSSHKRSGSNRGTAAARVAADLTMINDGRGTFGLTDLMKATAEVLGNGGLGSAYKATMANGLTVAVKRMRDMNRVGKEAFDGEMRRLGKLQHPNVLTPLAYHYRKEEKLIVSEYVPKGSLRYVLHGDRGTDHQALDWPTRVKIARGIARGMAYLHTELAVLDVPHGNLKSANVLLANDFEPLIADHGLAALVGAAQASQVMFAYRTPEGMQHHLVSPKSDVYCLGIVILELVTGKFPSQYMNNTKGGTDVVQWAASAIAEKREAELLDKDTAASDVTEHMARLLRVGAACVEANPEERPEVAEVAQLIEEIASAVAGEPRQVAEELL